MAVSSGLDCQLFYDVSGTWTLLAQVKNLKLVFETEEAEEKSRGSRYAFALLLHKDARLTFDYLIVAGDTGWTALNNAWWNETNLTIAIVSSDDDIEVEGTEYVEAIMGVFKDDTDEPVDNAVVDSFELAIVDSSEPTIETTPP